MQWDIDYLKNVRADEAVKVMGIKKRFDNERLVNKINFNERIKNYREVYKHCKGSMKEGLGRHVASIDSFDLATDPELRKYFNPDMDVHERKVALKDFMKNEKYMQKYGLR
jgi:hypothetical protein